jgi:hypothetical protein
VSYLARKPRMPRKQLNPFQLELFQRKKAKARIEREQKLRQRIFDLVKESDKERKRLIALAIYCKQVLRQQPNPFDDVKLDNHSNYDIETNSEASFQESEERHSKPVDYLEFILGLIIGFLIGLCIDFADSKQHSKIIIFL